METKEEVVDRQPDEATIRLLAQLKEKLYMGDMSRARRAAHNLSWMQEAGFEILKEGLIGKTPVGTKIAAAYGLRCMRGRMKQMALAVLLEGLKSPNENTRRVCTKTALLLTKKKPPAKPVARPGQNYKNSRPVQYPASAAQSSQERTASMSSGKQT